MAQRFLAFLWSNLGTVMLSFALAFAVWISAVIAADPNEIRTMSNFAPLEVVNLDSGLVLLDELPTAVTVELGAPASLWDQILNDGQMAQAYIDLSDLGPGEHVVPIEVEMSVSPTRILSLEPAEITLTLEESITKIYPITLNETGEVALGFEVDHVLLSELSTQVSGPSSLTSRIDNVVAFLSYTDERTNFSSSLGLRALDEDGIVINGLTFQPNEVIVQVFVQQSGGYREVAVAVETLGQPATGFRVIDITVDPPIVTLFSDDLELIEGLPGFVSTLPLDLSNAQEDIVSRLALNLPEGVSVEGDSQNVEVRIGISPIESSIPITLKVEIIGPAAGFNVEVSPVSVNLILSGPLAVLQSLAPGDVRLIVDVSELDVGTHLLGPMVDIIPEGVEVLSITPSSVEVVITLADN